MSNTIFLFLLTDSDTIYLDGKSSILYRFHQKSMSTTKDVISLKFKSMQSDGMLLHGEGRNGDRIALELIKGRLWLIINLGKVVIFSTFINHHISTQLTHLLFGNMTVC